MKSRNAPVLLITATLLAGAAHAASIPKTQTVTLDREAIVGATSIPAGTYRIELAAGLDRASFVQGRRTVAEASCAVEAAPSVYSGTAVHYRTGDGGHDRLTKIVFAGAKLAVEFPEQPVRAAASRGAGATESR